MVLLGVVEGFLSWSLRHPPNLGWWKNARAFFYFVDERNIIQLDHDCARYDKETGYTLRPGTCLFENREFSTSVSINSAGLRGSEGDLRSPEMIVLGDSFTMGWGVEESQSFVRLLANSLSVSVLNAGISSYDTPRELFLLRRLERSSLKDLLIQYSRNDHPRNSEYLRDPKAFNPMPEEGYLSLVRSVSHRADYYPGKYLIQFLPRLRESFQGKLPLSYYQWDPVGVDADREAADFLEILRRLLPSPPPQRILVFEMNPPSEPKRDFVHALQKRLDQGEWTVPNSELRAVDVSEDLAEDDWYPLDQHLRPSGHVKVAKRLFQTLIKPRENTIKGS